MDGWIADLMARVNEQPPNGRGHARRVRGRDEGQMLQTAKSISLFLLFIVMRLSLQLCRVGYK